MTLDQSHLEHFLPDLTIEEKIGGGHMCTQCVLNFEEISSTVTTLP